MTIRELEQELAKIRSCYAREKRPIQRMQLGSIREKLENEIYEKKQEIARQKQWNNTTEEIRAEFLYNVYFCTLLYDIANGVMTDLKSNFPLLSSNFSQTFDELERRITTDNKFVVELVDKIDGHFSEMYANAVSCCEDSGLIFAIKNEFYKNLKNNLKII